jgi:hypothetical protein
VGFWANRGLAVHRIGGDFEGQADDADALWAARMPIPSATTKIEAEAAKTNKRN